MPEGDRQVGTDVLTTEQRARCMANIRGRDTRPELLIRRGLFARGWRYRLHGPGLPGRPDLVFPARRSVIFVHGCFWHMHNCPLFRMPSTRRDFWEAKLLGNRQRDSAAMMALQNAGWRVLVIWECALKGLHKHPLDQVLSLCDNWLRNPEEVTAEIRGLYQTEL